MTQATATSAKNSSAAEDIVVPPLITGDTFRWHYQPCSTVDQSLSVAASVGGGRPHIFQIDTGSCGVAIGRSMVGAPFDKPDPSLTTTDLPYIPSGVKLIGQWTPGVPVKLLNPAGDPLAPTAVATTTVFIVDEPVSYAQGHGGMFGIGYQGNDLRATNPLMNVEINGGSAEAISLNPGYIITPEYLEVGLTAENQQSFGYAELQPHPQGGWMGPTAEVTLRGGPQFSTPVTLELPLLMDTGVRLMMLFDDPQQLPPDLQGATETLPLYIQPATEVSVDLPLAGTPPLAYSFGAANNVLEQPEYVQYMGSLHPGVNGVNTGIHVLRRFDYLFDGDKMRIGFRRRLL